MYSCPEVSTPPVEKTIPSPLNHLGTCNTRKIVSEWPLPHTTTTNPCNNMFGITIHSPIPRPLYLKLRAYS